MKYKSKEKYNLESLELELRKNEEKKFTSETKYFRIAGWFQDSKTTASVVWSFGWCSRDEREIIHDNQKIKLSPFSFIFGRRQCALETGLTEDEIRTRVKRFEKAGLLEKSPNKPPNIFTILRWVTALFSESITQQNLQQLPNSCPIKPRNKELRYLRRKENITLHDDLDFPLENIINFSNKGQTI